MPVVIITGPIGSGKTVTANALTQRTDGIKIAFADAVREEVSSMYNIPMFELTNRHFKEKWRRLLQLHGTEIRRQLFSENYWVDAWLSRVGKVLRTYGDQHPDDDFELNDTGIHAPRGMWVVNDDCRFSNELRAARTHFNAVVVRLAPNPLIPDNQSPTAHASEVEWRDFIVDLEVPWWPVEDRVDLIVEKVRTLGQ